MPVDQINSPNSVTHKPQYNLGQRLNSKPAAGQPGLEEDVILFPTAILRAFKNFARSPVGDILYIGLEIVSSAVNVIQTAPGYAVTDSDVYHIEPLTITPNAAARWGIIEIELEQSDENLVTLDFFSKLTGNFNQTAPTRYGFRVNVYDNHSPSASYPTVTAGRIPWIRYQLDDVGGVLVFVENLLAGQSGSIGFTTGDLKMSLFPGDGIDWLTVDGGTCPAQHIALINRLREARNNPINYPFTTDDAGGFIQLRFTGDPILDGLFVNGSPWSSSVEIVNASGGVTNGIFRLDGLDHAPADKKAIIGEAFNSAGAGEAIFRPFAIPDIQGGGCKLPPADFVRFMAPGALPNGDPRLMLTFQEWAESEHEHPWSFGSWFNSQGVAENASFSGLSQHQHTFAQGAGDGVFPFGGGSGHGFFVNGLTSAPHPRVDHFHSTYVSASASTGAPNNANTATEGRPNNLGLYLLIKT